jgi:rhodanese-related sulfurtransferase
MAPFPLVLSEILGHWGSYVIYLLIGFAFGFVLEIAGFGKSTKLAAQFYLKEMTVLKVMFGAIITAMVLIFLTSAIGLLDYNLIWVNPTYLWPGIIGGLIMGVGFIVGGFCPGTSLVAAATLKLDGIFFALGVFFGIFLFGETVGLFEDFWHSSYMGRVTLQDLFQVDAGVVVFGVVIMALIAFWFSEQGERIFGKMDLKKAPRWRYGAAAGLVVMAGAVMAIGQPTTEDRWARLAPEKEPLLAERAVQIEPAEMLSLTHDNTLNAVLLDVRDETDYNLFHIQDALHTPLESLPAIVPSLHLEPDNTVFFVMSNDETAATKAWQTLVAESVPNVYILGGGINNWISTFGDEEFMAEHPAVTMGDDELAYAFTSALGDRYVTAQPNPDHYELVYESKVVLETKRGPSGGGCG